MMLPMCDDEDCSDKELKLWLVVAFNFGSMRCVMCHLTNGWAFKYIQIYEYLNREKREITAAMATVKLMIVVLPPKFSKIFSSAVTV